MKRIWILTLVLVCVCGLASFGMAATQIKDVDSSHWAYKSVKLLIEKGYMSLYEDNTFRGDKSVTRYQLAEIVAKILEKIGEGSTTVNPADVTNIRQVTVEFRKELVEIAQNQNLFSTRVNQVEKNQVVMKEDIAKAHQQILQLIDQLALLKELDAQLKTTKGDVTKLQTLIAQVEKNMAEGLAFSVADLNKQIDDVKKQNAKEVEALKGENAALKEETAKLKEETATLTKEMTKLQEETKQLQVETGHLQEENTQMKKGIQEVKDKYYQMVYLFIGGFLISLFIR